MRPSVYICRQITEKALEIIAEYCDYRVWNGNEPVPRQILEKEIKNIDGLLAMLTDKIDDGLLAMSSGLKIISNMAAGYDNIDVHSATSKGIMVTNTPDVLTETTADLAFALILAASRRLLEAEKFLRNGDWTAWGPMLLTGQDVYGATIGIIGLGRIGGAVARRAKGFNMNIIYHNRKRNYQAEAGLGAIYVRLDELLASSDIISIHCPLTNDTRGLIGARELALMKPTSVLVNTARGGIIDEEALYEALLNQRIFAAGLDVFSREPLSADSRLLKLNNVTLLPHIGSASVATRTKMAIVAARNLIAGLTGKTPPDLVNPEVIK